MASTPSPPHPLTPPDEPMTTQSSLAPPAPTQSQSQFQSQSQSQPRTQEQIEALLSQPTTSLIDDGSAKRPRDARLIHLLLASHGISAYQSRVPLQLMDFAYRYTSGILNDALHIQSEGYDNADGPTTARGRKKAAGGGEEGDLTLQTLRVAIASRLGHSFQAGLPKEFLKGLAEERNRIGLNAGLKDADKSGPTIGGVKLPHEKYCLTGVGWGLKEEWDSEGEEEIEDAAGDRMQLDATVTGEGDGGRDHDFDEDNGAEEGEGNMEDFFGPDDAGGTADGGTGAGADAEMDDS